jgi:hypothetical protein
MLDKSSDLDSKSLSTYYAAILPHQQEQKLLWSELTRLSSLLWARAAVTERADRIALVPIVDRLAVIEWELLGTCDSIATLATELGIPDLEETDANYPQCNKGHILRIDKETLEPTCPCKGV